MSSIQDLVRFFESKDYSGKEAAKLAERERDREIQERERDRKGKETGKGKRKQACEAATGRSNERKFSVSGSVRG